jgi:hypothetical protein
MNGVHKSYRKILEHNEDFKVKYKFRSEEEGGRKNLPNQGIRCDFGYEHPNHELREIYMIRPEFEDNNGELIKAGQPSKEGVARMWIINSEMRKYHQNQIKVGTKGYFMEGPMKTADCEVIEIIDLMKNEIK